MILNILILLLFFSLYAGQDLSTLPNCTSPFREFDGICTGRGRPSHRLWGSSNSICFTYFLGRDSSEPVSERLISLRFISNQLFAEKRNKYDRRGLNEMAAYFAQFVFHDISLTRAGDKDMIDVPIPYSDQAGKFRDAIPFFRSFHKRSRVHDLMEFPVNLQTSAIDLSNIYGASKVRNNAMRTGENGLIYLSKGGLLPINPWARLENFPENSEDFFLSGDPRANENPVLTSLHTLFAREHNRIAKELAARMPYLTDDMLFMNARLINGAQFQKIVFEEWYPAMTNNKLPKYKGFQRNVDPSVSVSFSTAGFQVHHSMFGDTISRRGPRNTAMTPLRRGSSFFRTVTTLQENGIEPFLRGAFLTQAKAIDTMITSSRRNLLYSNVKGLESRVDIGAETIQRGRDHGLLSYNKLRAKFFTVKAGKFREITSNKAVAEALKKVYKETAKIDVYPGLLAEDHVKGSSMGPTLLNLWKREFMRIRDGDRFYFRSKKAIPDDIMIVPTVRRLLSDEDTFRRIVLDNTAMAPEELRMRLFFIR